MILTNKQTFSDAQLKLIEEKILQGKANEVLHLIPTNRKVRSLKKEIIDRTPAHAVSVLPIETIFTLAEKLFSVDKPLSLASEAASSVLLKKAFQKIVGERGLFKDWGGERSDLYTTQIVLKNARIPAAIAFKGRGTKGKLVPAKMGKNGDQVGRLFSEPAQLFLIVYNGQIDSSIISQMEAFAIGNALGGSKSIYFGVVDENDLGRLANAYSQDFSKAK